MSTDEISELNDVGHSIYTVENGATWWVIAYSPKEAIKRLKEFHIDSGLRNEFDELCTDGQSFTVTKLPLDAELTLCGDTKPIVHTVEDWLVIYDGCGHYMLGCSEY